MASTLSLMPEMRGKGTKGDISHQVAMSSESDCTRLQGLNCYLRGGRRRYAGSIRPGAQVMTLTAAERRRVSARPGCRDGNMNNRNL
jgi:hypothetical protein